MTESPKTKFDLRRVFRLIFMGGEYPNFSPEARRHILFINLSGFIGIAILLLMAFKSLGENKPTLAYFDGASGLLLLISIVFLRITKNYRLTSFFIVINITILYSFLLATGGSEGTGALWLLSYPFIIIFLIGLAPGIILCSLMLGGIVFFFLFPQLVEAIFSLFLPGYRSVHYSTEYAIRVIMSFILSNALAIFYEYVRKTTQAKLEDSMRELAQTTTDLINRRAETDSLLQNVKEGIFLIDEDFNLASEYSHELEIILEKKELAGRSLLDLLASFLPEKMSSVLKDYLEMLFAPDANLDLLKEINPISRVEFNLPKSEGQVITKHLEFNFTPVFSSKNTKRLLGTVRDITSEVKLAQELQEQEDKAKRQMEKLYEIINIEPALINEFITDTEEELDNINMLLKSEEEDYSRLVQLMYQSIHAVKGNALLLGLSSLSKKLHIVEDKISLLLTKPKVQWEDLFFISASVGDIYKEIDEIKSIIERLVTFQKSMQLAGLEQKNLLLTTLKRLVDRQCKDTGKEALLLLNNFDPSLISPRYRKLVKEILIQLIRNSLAHGIEDPETRKKLGKPPQGLIQLGCEKREGKIHITCRDNGQGLDPQTIKQKAQNLEAFQGLPLDSFNDLQLISLIFKPGFSTTSSVNLASGRGIGLSLIKQRLEDYSGELKVRTTKGKFTEFEIILPT